MTTINDDLALATEAAVAAGEMLRHCWERRHELHVATKRSGDFVSQADTAAETILKEKLLGARPGDGWLGEESGRTDRGSRRWIVDPLDGTTNFLRGIPHWAVSIGLEVEGTLCLGVVHDPVKQETFTAVTGQGAHLNGLAIDHSEAKEFERALLGTGFPFGQMAHIEDHTVDARRILPRCAGIRRMGAASLDLAYVAAGRLDGFWERVLQPWDIAAGLVLMREAGVVVEGWATDERPEDVGTVIAAAPGIFGTLAQLLREVDEG